MLALYGVSHCRWAVITHPCALSWLLPRPLVHSHIPPYLKDHEICVGKLSYPRWINSTQDYNVPMSQNHNWGSVTVISNYSLGKLLLWNLCGVFVFLIFPFFVFIPCMWKTVLQTTVCQLLTSVLGPSKCAWSGQCASRSTSNLLEEYFAEILRLLIKAKCRCESASTSFQRSLKVGPQVLPQGESTLLPGQKWAVLIVNWNLFQQKTWQLWMHCPDAYFDYEELIFWMLLSEKDSKLGPRHEGQGKTQFWL